MARLIEPTPTLQGEDGENFYLELERKRTTEEIKVREKLFHEAKNIFKTHRKTP